MGVTVDADRLSLRPYDSTNVNDVFDLLVDIYAEVYARQLHDPFFAVDTFADRLRAHSKGDGYALGLGQVDGEPFGYIYGYQLQPNARWWEGITTPVDPELITEYKGRTLALCEGMILPAWQGRGLARWAHDTFLQGRPEERTTLLVEQDNDHARNMYERWGYRKIAELRPSWPNAPLLDALILELSHS